MYVRAHDGAEIRVRILEYTYNQSITYDIYCDEQLEFVMEVCYSYSDPNVVLLINIDNTTTYNVTDSGYIYNYTYHFYGKHIRVEFSALSKTKGMLVRYCTYAIPKPFLPFWLFGVGAGVLIVAAIIGFFVYRRRAKVQRKRKMDQLAEQIKQRALKRLSLHPTDPYLIDPKKLRINFEKPIGDGFSAFVFHGHIDGESPLAKVKLVSNDRRFKDCEVAVKIAKITGNNDEELYLAREIEVLRKLGYHDHIIPMLGWYLQDGRPSIVMELAEHDLLARIKALKEQGAIISPSITISILLQVAKGNF